MSNMELSRQFMELTRQFMVFYIHSVAYYAGIKNDVQNKSMIKLAYLRETIKQKKSLTNGGFVNVLTILLKQKRNVMTK